MKITKVEAVKAIKSVKNFMLLQELLYPNEDKALDMAIIALEKQTPKKAVKKEVISQACPTCGCSVNYKYCTNCGQRVSY